MIRAALRGCYTAEQKPELHEDVLKTSSLEESIRCLKAQAQALKPSLMKIVKEAHDHDMNLFIEGDNLIPGMLDCFDLEVLLVASEDRLAYRAHKKGHGNVTQSTMTRMYELQGYLKQEAECQRIPVINADEIPRVLLELYKHIDPSDMRKFNSNFY